MPAVRAFRPGDGSFSLSPDYRPFRAGEPRIVPMWERHTLRSAVRAWRERTGQQ